LNPVDEIQEDAGHGSPMLSKQESGKSPVNNANYVSPVILDFLEDESIFMPAQDSRVKSKTEFARRDRVESEEECHLAGDAESILSKIIPNNSIKFNKPSHSVRQLSTNLVAIFVSQGTKTVNPFILHRCSLKHFILYSP